jgi:hypothetical protein
MLLVFLSHFFWRLPWLRSSKVGVPIYKAEFHSNSGMLLRFLFNGLESPASSSQTKLSIIGCSSEAGQDRTTLLAFIRAALLLIACRLPRKFASCSRQSCSTWWHSLFNTPRARSFVDCLVLVPCQWFSLHSVSFSHGLGLGTSEIKTIVARYANIKSVSDVEALLPESSASLFATKVMREIELIRKQQTVSNAAAKRRHDTRYRRECKRLKQHME